MRLGLGSNAYLLLQLVSLLAFADCLIQFWHFTLLCFLFQKGWKKNTILLCSPVHTASTCGESQDLTDHPFVLTLLRYNCMYLLVKVFSYSYSNSEKKLSWVYSATNFITFVVCRLLLGNPWEKISVPAAYGIVLTACP